MRRPFVPRPWQPHAIEHLILNKRAGLFLPPGLGKTSIVLRALCSIDLAEPVFPVLVPAPLRIARDTWSDEVAKWNFTSGLEVSPILGAPDERRAAINRKAHIYTINPENVPWLVNLFGVKWPFRTIVADEFSRWKSFRIRQGGQRARELYKVSFAPYCERFWGLTGSPAPNGLKDLYGQLHFLDGGVRLGRTFKSFEERWFRRGWDGYALEPMPHAQDEIQNLISDICLAIDPKDWIDLKEPVRTTITVKLPEQARRIYDQMEREMFTVIEQEGFEAFNAASKRIACSQLAQGALYLNDDKTQWKIIHDEKLQALESLVEELNGAPLIIAYHYRHDLARLKERFPHGLDLSKDADLKTFKQGGHVIGFAHPASLGHGIDGLQQACHHLAYFAHGDNLENHQQILERIGPMRQMQAGLDRNVFVYNIVAENTVEEYAILPNLEGKGQLQDLLLRAMRKR